MIRVLSSELTPSSMKRLPAGGTIGSALPCMIRIGSVIRPSLSGMRSTAETISLMVRAGSLRWKTNGSST